MRRLTTTLLALLLLGVALPARAFVPQTINVDGVNDFDASNLLRDDRNDTQTNCSPAALPMDLGRIYMTNDANYLYIGIEFAQTCYCDMNLGLAFNTTGATGGGTTDPFGRKIGWANVTTKPNWVIYDVTPTSCNTFNYEVLYRDTLGTWQNRSTLLVPGYTTGANGLGIVDSLNFKELKIPLSLFGLSAGNTLNCEFWVTQEGTTKGPLDAFYSSDVQMSHVGATTYDTSAVVQMTQMGAYVVQSAVDNAPPTVTGTVATGFSVLPNKQFSLITNKIDVQFSEPVDLTTAQTTGNYAFTGPVSRSIISAIRDAGSSSLVHLTLNSSIAANAAPYTITVTGVKDFANNTIVNNGTTNAAGFFIQSVTFNGDFRLGLCNGSFAVTDTFAVEGSVAPLTFQLCDNAVMTDANADSIYTVTVPFCLPRDAGTGKGTATLEWKFTNKCTTYEPLGSNRIYALNSDNGATPTVSAAWNNDDPANFIAHPVDVIFKVDASRFNPTGSDVVTLLGSAAPLHFTQPGVAMLDNGVAPDAVAGDKVYTARVTFPSCAPKNVDWKVDFNGVIECTGQGNRNVYLNDALFSSANPIVLPARGIDRCNVTDKPITVVFKVNMQKWTPLPAAPADTVAVKGSVAPLSWGWPPASDAVMADNGAGYDTKANDGWFTKAVTFPDSTPTYVEFKYAYKKASFATDSLECFLIANRSLTLDDQLYSVGSPMVRLLNVWDYCSDPTAILPEPVVPHTGDAFGVLRSVMPNPVARQASFAFELFRSGPVTFRVYDVTGRRVAQLVNGNMSAGVHTLTWDGRGDSGVRLASGVYMYEVAMGGARMSRRMILVH